MRTAFMKALRKLAEKDCDVMLLTGDLGFSVFEEFESDFPQQFINVGVAEQNMIGIASGLALEGKKVFVYSIGNFPTLRCLEQIRNDACYHQLNINIVAMGGGFSYGALGMSHHATEDMAIMKSLPNVKIAIPTTTLEAEQATFEILNSEGVGYLRLDKSFANIDSSSQFEFGKASILQDGNDFTIFVVGGIAEEAILAANLLKQKNISLKVVSLSSLKPLDDQFICSEMTTSKGIITLEEGTLINGLASSIADVCLANNVMPKKFHKMGIKDTYISIVGTQHYLRSVCDLTANDIVKTVLMWSEE
jgi:transketolase